MLSPSQLQALIFLLFTLHPAPSCRLGCLPELHLDMNPSFLPTNSWSSSLITKRHSDSLCCQLGCICLCAAQLMFQMIMPCFIIAVTRLCFVNIAHNRCAYLDTRCPILSCTVSLCFSLVCSGLKKGAVILFFFAKRIQSYYYYYQLSSVNVTLSTLILSIFFCHGQQITPGFHLKKQ